jgi:hypothetical protein
MADISNFDHAEMMETLLAEISAIAVKSRSEGINLFPEDVFQKLTSQKWRTKEEIVKIKLEELQRQEEEQRREIEKRLNELTDLHRRLSDPNYPRDNRRYKIAA